MKLIPLSKNSKTISGKYFAQVDDEDYDFLNKFTWCKINGNNNIFYCRTNISKPIQTTILLHRIIMKAEKGDVIDHIDHDGLNNQKSNLRKCILDQNNRNRRCQKNSSSKYLGVSVRYRKYKHVTTKMIMANISTNGKQIWLGQFKTEEDAARAYDEAAKKYHGEFANPNFKS